MSLSRKTRLRHKRKQLSALLVGLWCLNGLAFAEQTQDSGLEEFALEPIIITGTFADLPEAYAGGQVARGARVGMFGNREFIDTPFNQISFTSELIKNQQSNNGLRSILQNDPSVRLSPSQSTSFENYTIRGILTQGGETAFNGIQGLYPMYNIDTSFIERVEVLKGPAALFNGAGSDGGMGVGGTINIIPKRAGAEPTRELSLQYTSDSQIGGYFDFGQRYGKNQEYGVRVNLGHHDGSTVLDHEKQETSAVTVSLDARLERFRASLDVSYLRNVFDAPSASLVLNGYKLPSPPRGSFNFQPSWGKSTSYNMLGLLNLE